MGDTARRLGVKDGGESSFLSSFSLFEIGMTLHYYYFFEIFSKMEKLKQYEPLEGGDHEIVVCAPKGDREGWEEIGVERGWPKVASWKLLGKFSFHSNLIP